MKILHRFDGDMSPADLQQIERDFGAPNERDGTATDLRFGRVAAVTSGTVGGEHHTLVRNADAHRLRRDLEHGANVARDLLLDSPEYPTFLPDVTTLCNLVIAMDVLLSRA